jgi:TonB family protein
MKLDRREIDKNRNRPQLGIKILATTMCIASLISSPLLLSEELSSGPGSAVDAQGARHHPSDHGRKNPPWIDDAIKKVAPQYPYEARSRHQTGSGLLRITLNLRTGSVMKVTVIKSTGSPILDNAARSAFLQWRWKPGKWKEIDVPVTYTMGSGPHRLPAGAKPLPPQR